LDYRRAFDDVEEGGGRRPRRWVARGGHLGRCCRGPGFTGGRESTSTSPPAFGHPAWFLVTGVFFACGTGFFLGSGGLLGGPPPHRGRGAGQQASGRFCEAGHGRGQRRPVQVRPTRFAPAGLHSRPGGSGRIGQKYFNKELFGKPTACRWGRGGIRGRQVSAAPTLRAILHLPTGTSCMRLILRTSWRWRAGAVVAGAPPRELQPLGAVRAVRGGGTSASGSSRSRGAGSTSFRAFPPGCG